MALVERGTVYAGKNKPTWLAEKYALTTLPSVSALRALRVLAKKTGPGADPSAGFGNPVLGVSRQLSWDLDRSDLQQGGQGKRR